MQPKKLEWRVDSGRSWPTDWYRMYWINRLARVSRPLSGTSFSAARRPAAC